MQSYVGAHARRRSQVQAARMQRSECQPRGITQLRVDQLCVCKVSKFLYEMVNENVSCVIKAKFHYAIWFEPQLRSSKLVRSSNQLRTSFEPDNVMEFGREPASPC